MFLQVLSYHLIWPWKKTRSWNWRFLMDDIFVRTNQNEKLHNKCSICCEISSNISVKMFRLWLSQKIALSGSKVSRSLLHRLCILAMIYVYVEGPANKTLSLNDISVMTRHVFVISVMLEMIVIKQLIVSTPTSALLELMPAPKMNCVLILLNFTNAILILALTLTWRPTGKPKVAPSPNPNLK